jgi:hypothetical protein
MTRVVPGSGTGAGFSMSGSMPAGGRMTPLLRFSLSVRSSGFCKASSPGCGGPGCRGSPGGSSAGGGFAGGEGWDAAGVAANRLALIAIHSSELRARSQLLTAVSFGPPIGNAAAMRGFLLRWSLSHGCRHQLESPLSPRLFRRGEALVLREEWKLCESGSPVKDGERGDGARFAPPSAASSIPRRESRRRSRLPRC